MTESLWFPFTPMREWHTTPQLTIDSARGNYLYDKNGKRYLDGVASLWTNVHGHNHPILNQAITDQLHKVAHTTLLGLNNSTAHALADALVEVTPPGLNHVFFSDSGSTAVEIALKQAFQYWKLRNNPQKRKFVHLAESYHGDTVGAMSVGGISLFHDIFGAMMLETYCVPTPHLYRHPSATNTDEAKHHSIEAIRRLFAAKANEIAAFIMEPLIQGAGGMLTHPEGFLQEVARLCRDHDVLLIVDEVATGFGRTGTLFACEQERVKPDFLCLAKGITGGYLPLAATLSTTEIYSAFLGDREEYKTFFHGHTYTGNALACAAAIANLKIFHQEKTLSRLPKTIQALKQGLSDLEHPNIGDIRQRGLMVGVEMVANPKTKEPFPPEHFVGHQICQAIRDFGVILRNLGDVVVIMPPLSITEAEIHHLLSALKQAMGRVLQ